MFANMVFEMKGFLIMCGCQLSRLFPLKALLLVLSEGHLRPMFPLMKTFKLSEPDERSRCSGLLTERAM